MTRARHAARVVEADEFVGYPQACEELGCGPVVLSFLVADGLLESVQTPGERYGAGTERVPAPGVSRASLDAEIAWQEGASRLSRLRRSTRRACSHALNAF